MTERLQLVAAPALAAVRRCGTSHVYADTADAEELRNVLALQGRIAGEIDGNTVEPEFVEFLLEYRRSAEYRGLQDGERLRRRFEGAGFGDFFYAPDDREWQVLKSGNLPDLAAPLVGRIAVDSHTSLLADGDFVIQQQAIDAALLDHAFGPPEKRS